MCLAPAVELAEHLPWCSRVPECRGADLHGVGTRMEQLEGVPTGRNPTDTDDRDVGERVAALPDGPDGHRVHGCPGGQS